MTDTDTEYATAEWIAETLASAALESTSDVSNGFALLASYYKTYLEMHERLAKGGIRFTTALPNDPQSNLTERAIEIELDHYQDALVRNAQLRTDGDEYQQRMEKGKRMIPLTLRRDIHFLFLQGIYLTYAH
jgi:hypothetical protein